MVDLRAGVGGNVAEAYDIVSSQYDRLWNGPLAYAENHWTFSRLREAIKPRHNILDLGCGTGLLLDWLSPWIDPELYQGVDISDGMLREARRKHPTYVFLGHDVAEVPQWGRYYEVVVSTFAAFSYFREPLRVLRTLRRSMGAGAQLFLQPFGYGVHCARDYDLRDKDDRVVPYRAWGVGEFEELLLKAGFADIEVTGMTSAWLHRTFADQRSPFHNELLRDLYTNDLNGTKPMFLWASAKVPRE